MWYDLFEGTVPDQNFWSVDFIPALNTARFATYGRGIWDFVSGFEPEAQMMANDSSICSGNTLDFFDQSAGDATSWEWVFEGGQPEISTEKNPGGIYYELPGSYEVKLKVSNYFGLDSITNSNFIAVYETPAQPEIPVGPDSLYMNPEDTEFYTNSVPGAESYLWTLVPEDAGEILVMDTACLVDWSETFLGDAELNVVAIVVTHINRIYRIATSTNK